MADGGMADQHMVLFGVKEDALLVHMELLKGDQDGTKHADHPWHLCPVPEEPAICPCLAFIFFVDQSTCTEWKVQGFLWCFSI